jgi:hypothetical protein
MSSDMKDTLVLIWVLFLCVVAIVFSEDSHAAGEFYLSLGGVSHHFSKGDYNEQNFGIGAEYRGSDWSVGAGEYRNSERRRSFYEYAAFQPLYWRTVQFGVIAGSVTGYAKGREFFALPAVTAQIGSTELTLFAKPRTGESSPAVIGLNIAVRVF